jgi:hypothetical protein
MASIVAAVQRAQVVGFIATPSFFMVSPFICVDRPISHDQGLGSASMSGGGTNWRLKISGG